MESMGYQLTPGAAPDIKYGQGRRQHKIALLHERHQMPVSLLVSVRLTVI
jgi:hypothetical protein